MHLRTRPILTPLLALTLLPAPLRAAPSASPEPAACPAAQEAIASDRAGKYGEAGRAYERCARASDDPGLWKKAGMARYSGRQFAHAIQALDAYLRTSNGDAQAELMLEDARKNAATVRFSVVVAPGGPTPERLRVAPIDGAAGDELELPWSRSAVSVDVWLDPGRWTAELLLPGGARVGPQDLSATRDTGSPQVVLFRVEAPAVASEPAPAEAIELKLRLGPAAALRRGVSLTWKGPGAPAPETVRSAETRRSLPAGDWQVTLAAPRFVAQTHGLELRPGERPRLVVSLERSRLDRARIGLSAATGGAGLVLFATGLALAVGGGKRYRDAAGRLDGVPDAGSAGDVNAAVSAIERGSNGTLLLTSGLGAGIAAVTVAADGGKRLLGAEVGVGAVLLIAGVAWLIPAKRQYSADAPADGQPWAPDRAYLDERRRPEIAAASFIGLGAGLTAGATFALVTRAVLGRRERSERAASFSPLAAPRAVGLSLQGRF